MNKNIKVLIVDDHAIFRAGVGALLRREDDIEIIAEVADGRDAVQSTILTLPDIILMDLSMPNTNGIETIETIKKRLPYVKILVLTVHKEEEYVRGALKAGADGYSLKDDTHEELLIAIRNIISNKTYLSPSISLSVINGYLNQNKHKITDNSLEQLTHREREVIKLVAEGKTNKQIAIYLSLSTKTIEKNRSNLMKKLDLKNSSALVVYAIENGLV